jgi:hypothetical protein
MLSRIFSAINARAAASVKPVIPFPRFTHPRAGLSHAEWRALGPGEKLERLFGMSLGDLYEIMSGSPSLSSTRSASRCGYRW